MAFAGRACEFVFECLYCRGLRHGVGHIEKRRYASCRRRAAFAFYVGLVCKARLAEVYVAVYDARQGMAAGCVDYGVETPLRHLAFVYGLNGVALDGYAAAVGAPFVYDGGVFNQCPHGHSLYGKAAPAPGASVSAVSPLVPLPSPLLASPCWVPSVVGGMSNPCIRASFSLAVR